MIISLLWVAVLAATLAFARHDTVAALMMVPYLSWGTFALALNISVMQCYPSGGSICPLSAAVMHNCAR